MISKRIYLQDAAGDLRFKDIRSVKRWCGNNGVKIFSDNGSNKRYVIKEEFEEAKSRKLMNYLKQKELEFKKHNKYTPMGDHEKNFLSILTRKSSEL